MTSVAAEYMRIMQEFLDGTISTTEFEQSYFAKFKNETREIEEAQFEVLDELFGDLDAFTSDLDLIAQNPAFYINEPQLKEKVAIAIKNLGEWVGVRSW